MAQTEPSSTPSSPSSTPSSPSSTPSSPSPDQAVPPPIYQHATTGSFAKDVYLSVTNVHKIPCGRSSLLAGIASGFGIGVIRGLSTNVMVAANWGVGSFAIVSLGSWHFCQGKLAEERKRVEKIVEQMPQRMIKKQQEEEKKNVEV
ncbi:hypothetical protein BDV98DRAFT_604661 [Pterulicium gracile]|uniref:Cytochrome c oxidase assembly protein COX20, mitochondrial n=1 Tax=Pterulicium gracile TaxID=1884261 RepID=A0A5C3QJ55_9AGAR|nr:hypothetical protein BDV98DRAFT_604661 [Pterula gracilis]